ALPKVTSWAVAGSTLTMAGSDGKTLLGYEANPGASALAGNWDVLSYYSGNAITSVVGDAKMTAQFAAGQISGNTGCNSYSGPYPADGDAIKIGPLTSTKAACPKDDLAKQEQQYLAALELAATFQVSGDRLDLFRQDGGYAATYQRAA